MVKIYVKPLPPAPEACDFVVCTGNKVTCMIGGECVGVSSCPHLTTDLDEEELCFFEDVAKEIYAAFKAANPNARYSMEQAKKLAVRVISMVICK